MTSDIKLIFCSDNLNLRFVTLTDGKLVEIENKKDFQNITKDFPIALILPASSGLPFHIELPFGDKKKVERVIPQYVSDLYADVSENWIFSWDIVCENHNKKEKWIAFGLAFCPNFSLKNLIPEFQCNLAVPDCIVSNSIINNLEKGSYSIKTISLASESITLFSENAIIQRVIASNATIPIEPILRKADIKNSYELNLLREPKKLIDSLANLQQTPTNFDISGWHSQQKNSFLYLLKISSISLFLMLILIYHLFLWFEATLCEKAANRTTAAISQAFNSIFPNQPVVEPITQTKREISLIKSQINKSSQVPSIPWQKFLIAVYSSADSSIKIEKLSARTSSWAITGVASSYQNIDRFKKKISRVQILSEIKIRNSRSIPTGILFTLEGKWTK